MKRYAKPLAFVLAVLMAAALPLAAFAAYGTAFIAGDNVVYEAIKNSTNPKAEGSLRVTSYGATPDFTLAGTWCSCLQFFWDHFEKQRFGYGFDQHSQLLS